MPAAIPLVVAGATYAGASVAIGTAIAGAAIGTAAATAIGAGVIGTGLSLATGSNIGDALKTGVVSGVTAGIGSTIGSAVAGAGSAADAAFIAADASQLAAQGLSEAAITQNLVATGVSQAVAQTAAQAALSGATEAAIAETLGPGTLFQSPAAPIETATGVPAEQLAYPEVAVEQTYTPAPGSFQEALPEFGVQTQASAAPFTAAPGSFQAATAPAATAAGYGLLASPPSPALSLQDAFRTARLANSLLGEQPQQPQQQRPDLPPMQATGVDLLTLPNLQARTANVAGLLSPFGGNMQPSFDLLSGQTLLSMPRQSLLG
jgi:hypothetical protein